MVCAFHYVENYKLQALGGSAAMRRRSRVGAMTSSVTPGRLAVILPGYVCPLRTRRSHAQFQSLLKRFSNAKPRARAMRTTIKWRNIFRSARGMIT